MRCYWAPVWEGHSGKPADAEAIWDGAHPSHDSDQLEAMAKPPAG
jgi:hypothetical protein